MDATMTGLTQLMEMTEEVLDLQRPFKKYQDLNYHGEYDLYLA